MMRGWLGLVLLVGAWGQETTAPTFTFAPTSAGMITKFLGVDMAVSFEPGSLEVEWSPATVSGGEIPEYTVLVVPEGSEDGLVESLEAIRNASIAIERTTTDLHLTLDGLTVGEIYFVLVIAVTSVDESTNRDTVTVTIASRMPVMTPDVRWKVVDDDLNVELVNGVMTVTGNLGSLRDTDSYEYLVGQTMDMEFYAEKMFVLTNEPALLILTVVEVTLATFFQELSFDADFDAAAALRKEEASSRRLLRGRQLQRSFTLIDKRIVAEETVSLTDNLDVTMRDEVNVYVGGTFDIGFFTPFSADVRANAGYTRTVTLSYESETSLVDFEIDRTLWTGPRIRFRFFIGAFPVWISLQPKLKFTADGSAVVLITATLEVKYGGRARARIAYDNDDKSVSSSASVEVFAGVEEATVDGSLTVEASAAVIFVITTSLYSVIDVDVNLQASLTFEGLAELGFNFITMTETAQLSKFDVDAVFSVPVVGRIIFGGERNLGELYRMTWELLRLPSVEILPGPATCNDQGDASLMLMAMITPGIGPNDGTTPQRWGLDIMSPPGWTPGPTGTTTLTLTLPNAAEDGLNNDDVPRGTVGFRMTPEIPPLPWAIPAETQDLFDLFRNAFAGVECGETMAPSSGGSPNPASPPPSDSMVPTPSTPAPTISTPAPYS